MEEMEGGAELALSTERTLSQKASSAEHGSYEGTGVGVGLGVATNLFENTNVEFDPTPVPALLIPTHQFVVAIDTAEISTSFSYRVPEAGEVV
jgi:hypothetical protein